MSACSSGTGSAGTGSTVKQRCRDGVMNDFLSWCRHLLFPFLFYDVASLHPPSFHTDCAKGSYKAPPACTTITYIAASDCARCVLWRKVFAMLRYYRPWDLLTVVLFFCCWRTPTVEGWGL